MLQYCAIVNCEHNNIMEQISEIRSDAIHRVPVEYTNREVILQVISSYICKMTLSSIIVIKVVQNVVLHTALL